MKEVTTPAGLNSQKILLVSEAKTPRPSLVYIAGSGHSGSTLLDMMLGGNQYISSLGEVHRLTMNAFAREDAPAHHCTCGRMIQECPFWQRVSVEFQRVLGVEDPEVFKNYPITEARNVRIANRPELWSPKSKKRGLFKPRMVNLAVAVGSRPVWNVLATLSPEVQSFRKMIRNSIKLYEAVRIAHGTPICIDSTKNPTRLQGLFMERLSELRVIYLLRDGRAVCASRMRREKVSMSVAAKVWKAEHTKQKLVHRLMPQEIFLRVTYEDICRNPQQELNKICDWLGVDFEPRMLDFRHERHNLGGNPMRARRHEADIRFDERWRQELSQDDLAVFDKIAGDLNRSLGYGA